jgi:hypothetical protein
MAVKKLRRKKERLVESIIECHGGELLKNSYDFDNLFKNLGQQPTEPHYVIGIFRNTTENITGEYIEYMEYYVFYNWQRFDECRQELNTMTKDFVVLESYMLENHQW